MAETKLLLFSELHDFADTSYRYGVYTGVNTGEKFIKTAGSSTTVTENTSGDAVFQGFAAGDLIHTKAGADGAWSTRILTAVASAASVTVNAVITLTGGKAWSYQKWINGTTASDGWFSVANLVDKSVEFEWVTKNATSADVSIEGRIAGGGAAVLYTENFTAVGKEIYPITETVDEIRVGIKINTDAGTNNVRASFRGEDRAR
jgi:hypothetical protein